LAGETSLGLLAPEQPAGAMDGRVERGTRLRALDALDDHRIVAHRTADKATLTRERRRRALAHHPYIAPLAGLTPRAVMVVRHRVGRGAADDSPHPLHHPLAARVGITARELHRCDVPAPQCVSSSIKAGGTLMPFLPAAALRYRVALVCPSPRLPK